MHGVLEMAILRMRDFGSWKLWGWHPETQHPVFSKRLSFRCVHSFCCLSIWGAVVVRELAGVEGTGFRV